MITQAIKNWFRKMFAWWPWKQPTPLEYQHVARARMSEPTLETSFWISRDGTVPQAGATPRRFTLEGRAERLAQQRPDALDAPPYSPPVAFLQTDANQANEPADALATPTPKQRLEFLRYLVQRGLVNEGFENDPPASSS
ncbi:MAG TPA: hypothetical protein VF458_12125 [Ktedonobacteraceae bacterium]